MEEVLGEEENQMRNNGGDDEEMKGIDFSQVPLSAMDDKGSSKTLIEDENFEFQVTNP
jgi:hypothetical protein